MKFSKIMALCVAGLVMSTGAFAQFSFGLKTSVDLIFHTGGAEFANVEKDLLYSQNAFVSSLAAEDITASDSHQAFLVTGFFEFPVYDKVGVQIDVSYASGLGYNSKFSAEGYTSMNETFSYDAVEVGVMAKYLMLDMDEVIFYLGGGLYGDFSLTNTKYFISGMDKSMETEYVFHNKFNMGVMGGFDFGFRVNPNVPALFTINGYAKFDFLNTFNSKVMDPSFVKMIGNSFSFPISIGVMYKI